jgi:RNA methyltransferase, TrmH family
VRSLPTITSRRHPIVQRCRQIASGDSDANLILLDGEHLIEEALASRVPIRTLLATRPGAAIARAAARAGAEVYGASETVLDAASPVQTPTGFVAIAEWAPAAPQGAFADAPALIVGLVDVQDPGNVGGAIRSADALGATGVVCLGRTAAPGSWRALRGAMGSTFHLPVARASIDAIFDLAHDLGVRVAATVIDDGEALTTASLAEPVLFALGNEGAGLPASVVSRADLRIRIPMRAGVNSLNVAAAAAVLLFEASRQRA